MVVLTKQQTGEMIAHAKAEAPAEACGLMAGVDNKVVKLYQTTNEAKSDKHYLVSPKEQFDIFKQIRKDDMELLGIYHSHVASPPYPSATDCEMAVYDVHYFIVSLQDDEQSIKAYKIKDKEIEEKDFQVE
ncbi:hypothetical protein LCGC14_0975480 [marine sediment metagenome]|uniref:MPN domain-containing protein n=1 Tax=marine sediment metagenome TaxID=412755 RepID=A0A0F9NEU7_9ZZZZ